MRSLLVQNGSLQSGTSFAPQVCVNAPEMWSRTDRPRQLVGPVEGQREDTLDVMRRVSFRATADGTAIAAPLASFESGTTASYRAGASVVLDQAGTQGCTWRHRPPVH